MKNILILGSGAREEVIKEKLRPNHVHILSTNKFEDIKNYCTLNKIELVIPCQENYLCSGIVDYLKNQLPDIEVFGPDKMQSKIEGNKYFAKNLMTCLKIPTAPFTYHNKYDGEFEDLDTCVIKYCGLAKGKGVFLPRNEIEAFNAMKKLTREFKNNWEGVIIEERLYGQEVSVLAFCNGKNAFLMPQTQDYKNLLDNDYGPNTGGMGAIAPVNILTDDEMMEVQEHLNSVVRTLKYKGILYAGIMKTEDGYFFLEFNCRFGDPEAQVILNLLDTPLLNIINQCLNKQEVILEWKKECAATVVLSHNLYPESKLEEPTKIEIDNMPNEVKIYNSSVDDNNSTYGGRVMSLVSLGSCIPHALQIIYNNIHRVNYNGIYFRRDIGSNYYSDNNIIPNVGVLASGNGTCLETVLQNTNSIKIIITNNKKAGVIEKCKKYKVPFFYLDASFCSKDEYYEKVVNIMRLFNVKLVLLAGYTKIVPKILFDEFHTINIHPSLLPSYKGLLDLNIHGAVLENQDKYTGCTLHEVVEDVDGGWILLQKQMTVKTESVFTLKMQVQELEKMCVYEYICNYPKKIKYNVNVAEGNDFVNLLKKDNSFIGGFCATYKLDNGTVVGATVDGVGTKLDLAIKHNILDTIGIDLVAMNVNDLIAGGFKVDFFMDYIAIDKMDKTRCYEIIKGIQEGCKIAKCSLIGGETAEMKNIYLKNKFDLAGFALGTQQIFLPKTTHMNENCYLYGLSSSGIHSNGYTLVNELLLQECKTYPDIKTLLEPTRIYNEVYEYYEKYADKILGVAHITGGGFYDNLSRVIPEYLSFELINWEFPEIFKWIQYESNFSRRDMLNTFNCGYGMVFITNSKVEFGDYIGRLKNKDQ